MKDEYKYVILSYCPKDDRPDINFLRSLKHKVYYKLQNIRTVMSFST